MSTETQPQAQPSLQGKLLVAAPYVQQAPYRHSVVLVVGQSERGSLGLVLENNLPGRQVGLAEQLREDRPGANRLSTPSQGQASASEASASQAGKAQPSELHLFHGCVFWAPGHLEREVQTGIWMTTAAKVDAAGLSQDLWTSLVRQIGRAVLSDTLHLKGFPTNVNLN